MRGIGKTVDGSYIGRINVTVGLDGNLTLFQVRTLVPSIWNKEVREGAPHVFASPPRPCKLAPFKDYLRQRFEEHRLSAVRLTMKMARWVLSVRRR